MLTQTRLQNLHAAMLFKRAPSSLNEGLRELSTAAPHASKWHGECTRSAQCMRACVRTRAPHSVGLCVSWYD